MVYHGYGVFQKFLQTYGTFLPLVHLIYREENLVRGDKIMKKVFVVLIVTVLLMSFAGCRSRHTPENPAEKEQIKVVHIDSEPQGATVFIDNMAPIITPADVKLSIGWHYIKFRKDGYEEKIISEEIKEDTSSVSVVLVKPLSEGESLLFAT
jgi:hypothetical protein